ncbi:MAG: hypothetical protein ACLQBY_18505 [Solirubrobacteraceae bacterium]
MSTATPSALTADEIAANKQSADEEFAEAVETRFLEIAADAEVVTDDRIDKKLVAQRVYEVVKTKHVVDIEPDKDDRRDPAKSSCKEELAADIFPEMPTGSEADMNMVDARIREKCMGAVWDVTQTGERGQVQKLLRGDNLILIRGTVFRDTLTVNSGIYVSTHEEIVLREFLAPRLEKLRKLTDVIEGDYEMAKDRVPGIGPAMRAAIQAAMIEAMAKLPVDMPGLTKPNGQNALDK